MNAPTLVPSVRSSLRSDALYCGRQFFHSAQCQSIATFALKRNNIAETHIMHRTYVPRSFGIVFSDQIQFCSKNITSGWLEALGAALTSHQLGGTFCSNRQRWRPIFANTNRGAGQVCISKQWKPKLKFHIVTDF